MSSATADTKLTIVLSHFHEFVCHFNRLHISSTMKMSNKFMRMSTTDKIFLKIRQAKNICFNLFSVYQHLSSSLFDLFFQFFGAHQALTFELIVCKWYEQDGMKRSVNRRELLTCRCMEYPITVKRNKIHFRSANKNEERPTKICGGLRKCIDRSNSLYTIEKKKWFLKWEK